MTAAAAVTFVLGVTLGLSQSFWAVIPIPGDGLGLRIPVLLGRG
jgi:GMP synthase PP-ATPase subunit